jgi:hypothetical protein
VDGDNSNNSSRWVSANSAWPHWIKIDLQDTYSINRLKFWTGYDGYEKAPADFQFQRWDGSGWVDIIVESGNTDPVFSRTFTPVTTSRVRLYGTAGIDNYFRLYEIEVFGVAPDAGNAAPVFTADPLSTADGLAGVAYNATISGSATDADSDPLIYSKISGPIWLNVASDGTLYGTPAFGDGGTNVFSVQVADGRGGADVATLNITVDDGYSVLDFNPTDDTYANEKSASETHGTETVLKYKNDSGARRQPYLKFTVSGTESPVIEAKLRLYNNLAASNVTLYDVSDTSWTEGSLTWNNKPAMGAVIQTITDPAADTWIEFDVTNYINGNGTYSFGLQTTSNYGTAPYSSGYQPAALLSAVRPGHP